MHSLTHILLYMDPDILHLAMTGKIKCCFQYKVLFVISVRDKKEQAFV